MTIPNNGVIFELVFTSVLALLVAVILQDFIVNIKIKKIGKDWNKIKSILALVSFKNYLNVVSSEDAIKFLEEALVGLRTLPSIDSVVTEAEKRLISLKGGLKALLESLELIDKINTRYQDAIQYNKISSITSYVSLVSLFISLLLFPIYSFIFLGVALGLGIDSASLLILSLYNIEKIERYRREIRNLIGLE